MVVDTVQYRWELFDALRSAIVAREFAVLLNQGDALLIAEMVRLFYLSLESCHGLEVGLGWIHTAATFEVSPFLYSL